MESEVSKIKKNTCFLNLNDCETNSQDNQCFNSYTVKRNKKCFPAQKHLYNHGHVIQTVALFIIDENVKLNYQKQPEMFILDLHDNN